MRKPPGLHVKQGPRRRSYGSSGSPSSTIYKRQSLSLFLGQWGAKSHNMTILLEISILLLLIMLSLKSKLI